MLAEQLNMYIYNYTYTYNSTLLLLTAYLYAASTTRYTCGKSVRAKLLQLNSWHQMDIPCVCGPYGIYRVSGLLFQKKCSRGVRMSMCGPFSLCEKSIIPEVRCD